MKKFVYGVVVVSLLALVLCAGYYWINRQVDSYNPVLLDQLIDAHYGKIGKINKKAFLYSSNYKRIGVISEDQVFAVDRTKTSSSNPYFYLPDIDCYVYFDDITPVDEMLMEKKKYHYLPFQESVTTKQLYQNGNLVYRFYEELKLPIYKKDKNEYLVQWKQDWFVVKKEDVLSVVEEHNTDEEYASGIRTFVYHAFYDKTEGVTCNTVICHEKQVFEQQMKYLYDEKYVTVTMEELEAFIDGKVNLPKKSVVLTIDDGGESVKKIAYPILEQYNMHATLFLITGSYSAKDYEAPFIELHSHTHKQHRTGVCPGGQGSPLKCLDEKTLLADFKDSREALGGSKVLCYPFYEFNEHAIEIAKKAGFTMAFENVGYKITLGMDKMKLPRYTVLSTSSFEEFVEMTK